MSFLPTKEQGVCALAVLASLWVVGARLNGGAGPQALAAAPSVEEAVALASHEVPVLRPRLRAEPPPRVGRNPFAAASVWEDPVPAPLALPPERIEGRLVPVMEIGGGRAWAPRAPMMTVDPIPDDDDGSADEEGSQ